MRFSISMSKGSEINKTHNGAHNSKFYAKFWTVTQSNKLMKNNPNFTHGKRSTILNDAILEVLCRLNANMPGFCLDIRGWLYLWLLFSWELHAISAI